VGAWGCLFGFFFFLFLGVGGGLWCGVWFFGLVCGGVSGFFWCCFFFFFWWLFLFGLAVSCFVFGVVGGWVGWVFCVFFFVGVFLVFGLCVVGVGGLVFLFFFGSPPTGPAGKQSPQPRVDLAFWFFFRGPAPPSFWVRFV